MGKWHERYIATGGDTDPDGGETVRATLEYPRALLEFAKEAAADRSERLCDVATRALAEEVRRMAVASASAAIRGETRPASTGAAVRPRPARPTTGGGRRESRLPR
jgi:hypothetical protein